jgi:hypothetical protein
MATRKKAVKRAAKQPTRQSPTNRKSKMGNRKCPRFPAGQGKDQNSAVVGYGKPPIEHQFAPGQSGNPAGTPASRANLWRYLCRFLEEGEASAQRAKDDRSRPLAIRIAAKQALQLLRKGFVGVGTVVSMRTWDRDEGRPVAHVVMESPDVLTPEECEEIRQAMRTGGK